jgi:hypothetical protein
MLEVVTGLWQDHDPAEARCLILSNVSNWAHIDGA